MLYLLDTNAVSDLIRDHPKLRTRLSLLTPSDTIAVSTIVIGEILYGLERLPQGKRRDDLTAKATNILASISKLSVSPEVAAHYAIMKSSQQRAGLSVDENDLWIAATAVHYQATLVSRDSDLSRIPGLVIEDWT